MIIALLRKIQFGPLFSCFSTIEFPLLEMALKALLFCRQCIILFLFFFERSCQTCITEFPFFSLPLKVWVGHNACRLLAAQVFDFYAHFGERCLIMLTFFFQCKIFFSPAEICGIIWQAGLRVLFKIAVGPILGTMAEIRA